MIVLAMAIIAVVFCTAIIDTENADAKLIEGHFTVDGICYRTSGSSVDIYDHINYDKDELVIPTTVQFKGKEYKVRSIEYAAFYECKSIKSLIIPDGIKSIGGCAFQWCDSLETVIIGNDVTSIGGQAFYECKALKSVTIGKSVKSIGISTFEGCSILENVQIIGTEKVISIKNDSFKDCDMLKNIFVPSEKLDDYKEAKCWSSLKDNLKATKEINGIYTKTVVTTGQNAQE